MLLHFGHSCQALSQEKPLAVPATTSQVLQFIVLLYQRGLSCASICSQLSAISFWHNINAWPNPVDTFVVRKCLTGISNLCPPHDPLCLPVTPSMLRTIVQIIPVMFSNPFEAVLLKAIFLLSFFAFLRVSEYAQSWHTLQLCEVSILRSSLLIRFRSFSFSSQHITKILLPAIPSDLCPVKALSYYLSVWPTMGGPLFLTSSSQPITYQDIRSCLRRSPATSTSQTGL